MLPYSWSTETQSFFISKVVLALTLLIKSIFSILAITSNFSQRETTIALKVWFMALFYCRTLSNACRILLFNLLHGLLHFLEILLSYSFLYRIFHPNILKLLCKSHTKRHKTNKNSKTISLQNKNVISAKYCKLIVIQTTKSQMQSTDNNNTRVMILWKYSWLVFMGVHGPFHAKETPGKATWAHLP